MLEGESERGMVISHCYGYGEKEQVWSNRLRIMGDAQRSVGFTAKAAAGAQMAMEPIIVCVVGPGPLSIYKATESGDLHGRGMWGGILV